MQVTYFWPIYLFSEKYKPWCLLQQLGGDFFPSQAQEVSFELFRDGTTLAHTFPTYNNDKRWYTPAFLLDMDKNYSP